MTEYEKERDERVKWINKVMTERFGIVAPIGAPVVVAKPKKKRNRKVQICGPRRKSKRIARLPKPDYYPVFSCEESEREETKKEEVDDGFARLRAELERREEAEKKKELHSSRSVAVFSEKQIKTKKEEVDDGFARLRAELERREEAKKKKEAQRNFPVVANFKCCVTTFFSWFTRE